MVISEIVGGLGNQMFQYAAGLSLAKQLNTQFFIDLTSFKKYKKHRYTLNKLAITSKAISPFQLNVFKWLPFKTIYNEPHFHFDNKFYKLTGNIFLSGYWQSQRYFKGATLDLRKEFQLKNKPRPSNSKLQKMLHSTNSIAIHLRRADYLQPDTKAIYGSLGLDYYHTSIKHLLSKVKKPTFAIFSDDPGWVKANLKLKHPVTYVDGNQDRPEEDMWLISQCKHQIIANSTFSWWGAWLNTNPKKIVIAPKNWFGTMQANTKDLIPSSWIRA